MANVSIAVTGISGLLGQRLLPLLDSCPEVDRIVGLDVRDPARRASKLDFYRVDVARTDLEAHLEGVDVLVHLAGERDPIPDEALARKANLEGTRRLLQAAGAAGVSKVVKLSSAAVYGAWNDNPVPLSEDALLRPNSDYLPPLHDAECERLIREWRSDDDRRRTVVLRSAPVVGPGAVSLLARAALGGTIAIRAAHRAVQVVHVDDMASAIVHAVREDLDGVYNVAADSWLEADEGAALVGRRSLPSVPARLARWLLGVGWATGVGDAPPSVIPYLVHPWVVANGRLKATGWQPRHTNEEAILLSTEPARRSRAGVVAAVGALIVGAVVAAALVRRRVRSG